jgi:hypothetical protein
MRIRKKDRRKEKTITEDRDKRTETMKIGDERGVRGLGRGTGVGEENRGIRDKG